MDINLTDPAFWFSVGQIILIDILLGGDNAVVIALACRKLPEHQRNKGIFWGVVGAVVARIVLIFFALQLLALPFLKAVGALLLLWIGVKLMQPEDDDAHGKLDGGTTVWSAVRTVIIADVVMSLDNVIAVAAAADGHLGLVVFGILVSVPIIVWGSKFVLMLIDRFPAVVTLGAALLGWIAGAMLIEDQAWKAWYEAQPTWTGRAAAVAGAVLVVAIGSLLARRAKQGRGEADHAEPAALSGPRALQRVLLAVDGSDSSVSAAKHLLSLRGQLRDPQSMKVDLLNVQRPVSGDVASFINADVLDDYHRELADKDLAPVREVMTAAGVPFEDYRRLGNPGEAIAAMARELGSDLIVMGSRGLGAPAGALLGSVVRSTLEHAPVPVLVAKV